MKDSFPETLKLVFASEGGFTNHPDDNEGMTTWGITISELKEFRKDKSIGREEMKNLTQEEAAMIYEAWYWKPLRCDDLPKGVDYVVFDAGILHGIHRAGIWLQMVTGVGVDGKIGPVTVAAAKAMDAERIIRGISELRRRRVKGLVDYKVFGRGWLNRITRVSERGLKMAGIK